MHWYWVNIGIEEFGCITLDAHWYWVNIGIEEFGCITCDALHWYWVSIGIEEFGCIYIVASIYPQVFVHVTMQLLHRDRFHTDPVIDCLLLALGCSGLSLGYGMMIRSKIVPKYMWVIPGTSHNTYGSTINKPRNNPKIVPKNRMKQSKQGY